MRDKAHNCIYKDCLCRVEHINDFWLVVATRVNIHNPVEFRSGSNLADVVDTVLALYPLSENIRFANNRHLDNLSGILLCIVNKFLCQLNIIFLNALNLESIFCAQVCIVNYTAENKFVSLLQQSVK